MSLLTATIRRAEASETERLVEIALAAWDRDLRPFLSGPAANPATERRRIFLIVRKHGRFRWCVLLRLSTLTPPVQLFSKRENM